MVGGSRAGRAIIVRADSVECVSHHQRVSELEAIALIMNIAIRAIGQMCDWMIVGVLML